MELVSPEPNTGCWLWLGALNNRGYGVFWDGTKKVLAHRWAYEHFVGPLGDLQGCHRCDTPWCASPYHVFPGTQSENLLDAGRKHRNVAQVRPELLARGSRHGEALLDEAKVAAARAEYALGQVSLRELAERYGVAKSTIHAAITRRNWRLCC